MCQVFLNPLVFLVSWEQGQEVGGPRTLKGKEMGRAENREGTDFWLPMCRSDPIPHFSACPHFSAGMEPRRCIDNKKTYLFFYLPLDGLQITPLPLLDATHDLSV